MRLQVKDEGKEVELEIGDEVAIDGEKMKVDEIQQSVRDASLHFYKERKL